MLSLNTLKSADWSRKTKKRLWRWNGSGKWNFSWKGCKWQNARSGKMPAWFEWWQTPLFRRTPKLKWFSNHIFMKKYNIVNLSDLELLASKWITEITKEVLLENWVIRKKQLWLKLLGNWELKTKINITLEKISVKAKTAIEKVGGSITIIEK